MDNHNPQEPIVRDEKYMEMFDQWLRQQKAEERRQEELQRQQGQAGEGETYAQEAGKAEPPAQKNWAAQRLAEEQGRAETQRLAEEQRRAEAQREAERFRQTPEARRQSQPAQWDGSFYPQGQPPKPPKKSRAKKVWLWIGILIGGIALGVAVTLLCTAAPRWANSWAEEPGPAAEQQTQKPSQASGNQGGGTGQAPNLDGKAPAITDYSNPVPEIAENTAPSVVGVMAEGADQGEAAGEMGMVKSRGTGFIISTDGYIVTNNHVVEGKNAFTVTMQDGTEHEAKYIGSDVTLDIAVLKIDADNLTALPIGDSDSVRVGELVVAIGNPQGAGQNLTGTVSVGYISAVNRELMFNNTKQKFLQTDAAMNPGNSGGPLVNSKGEVIGVVTLKSLISTVAQDGSTVTTEGIGFAIPIKSAIAAATEIIETGTVTKPGIGIYCGYVDEETAAEEKIVAGMFVSDFMTVSPAYDAGMRQGDVITEYDGNKVKTGQDLIEYIKGKKVGDTITFKVWRKGEKQELEMKVTIANTNQP